MSDPDSEIDAREPPAFWIGVAGFSREQRAVIESSMNDASRLDVDWRLCDVGEEADAWLVNGDKCHVLPDGKLRVSPGMSAEAALCLDMRAVDRPVAFAMPVSDTYLEPHYTFDASSSASVLRMLAEFESCLLFVRAQFVLGAQVVERGAALRHGIFHVSYRSKLLAILDFRHGEVWLCPQLDPAEVQQARWVKRPHGAVAPPPDFVRLRPAQLSWNYVRRSDGNLLPPRYRTRTIYYRRSPRVPLSWLRDSQLRILRELSCEGASLFELGERTGFTPPQLERDIASLFYASAITTTASKAGAPAAKAYAKLPVLTDHASAYAQERSEPTVPGVLSDRARG